MQRSGVSFEAQGQEPVRRAERRRRYTHIDVQITLGLRARDRGRAYVLNVSVWEKSRNFALPQLKCPIGGMCRSISIDQVKSLD